MGNGKYRIVLVLMVCALLLSGCSRKGVHMPKHRKVRHCNCPTFAMNSQNEGLSDYGEWKGVL